jgi:hypothetical protein
MMRSAAKRTTVFDALDEREAQRQPLRLVMQARSALRDDHLVTMLNVSNVGALISTSTRLPVGSFTTLVIKDSMIYGAWIVWSGCGFAGLSFANPLPHAVVDHLAELGRRRHSIVPTQ